jgi:hypothetical protein
MYLLYYCLIDVRVKSYELNEPHVFGLVNLLHNVPIQIANDIQYEKAYDNLLESVKKKDLLNWLNDRINEFKLRFTDEDIQTVSKAG